MNTLIKYFIGISLVALLGGVLFGCFSAFQFLYPAFFSSVPFFKTRPLHVSSVVGWIFLASAGSIYYFIGQENKTSSFSVSLTRLHLFMFISGGFIILISYLFGYFGGREYWEFNPIFSLMILCTWLFFLLNFFHAIKGSDRPWPVYYWMWCTGVVFFMITFIEANLWMVPYFGDHIIRDLTVQWKAYGALVGSWNMLVYGIAIYLLTKIKNDPSIAKSKLAFAMYFLGFFNLLFGWAHHIYVVPCPKYIRVISYAVSMTELLILFKLIWSARPTIQEGRNQKNNLVYNFLFSSDIWVLLNLFLALLISIPAINVYTHGTHITVAHAMGSTIGINTFILLASVCYITLKNQVPENPLRVSAIKKGVRGLNISLGVFWVCLIGAGVKKGMHTGDPSVLHQAILEEISPFLLGFALAGTGILASLLAISLPLLRSLLKQLRHG